MRSVSVVCDNHTDRPAVATFYVSRTSTIGSRSRGSVFAPAGGRYHDLCAECASVLGLGWSPPELESKEDEPVTDAQRRLIFARCRELGIDEDARHALLERVTGNPSMRDLAAGDVDAVIAALDQVEAVAR